MEGRSLTAGECPSSLGLSEAVIIYRSVQSPSRALWARAGGRPRTLLSYKVTLSQYLSVTQVVLPMTLLLKSALVTLEEFSVCCSDWRNKLPCLLTGIDWSVTELIKYNPCLARHPPLLLVVKRTDERICSTSFPNQEAKLQRYYWCNGLCISAHPSAPSPSLLLLNLLPHRAERLHRKVRRCQIQPSFFRLYLLWNNIMYLHPPPPIPSAFQSSQRSTLAFRLFI